MVSPHPQRAIQAQSLEQREAFWLKAAQSIHWHQPPTRAFGPSPLSQAAAPYAQGQGGGTWFPGAQLNNCYNALDRHVYPPLHADSRPVVPSDQTAHLEQDAAGANKIAIHHVSPLPFQKLKYRSFTYAQALVQVQLLAGVLRSKGVKKGDTVVIYMPLCPETAFAMLACNRLGAIHSVVFGGFAPRELAKRIDDAKPVMLLSASCGLEPKGPVEYKPLVDAAFGHCKYKPQHLLFLRRTTIEGHSPPQVKPEGVAGVKEWDWEDEMEKTKKEVDGRSPVWECVPVASEDPCYTLYTSGTTGAPKGVVRLTGGHAVALRYAIEHNFGMTKADTMLCASDLGWVVGHSYIAYSPLLLGASTVFFEGKPVTPDAGILWRTITSLRVTHLFTAPTALRAVRGQDQEAKLMRAPGVDLRTLRTLFLAGERSEPSIVEFYQEKLSELGALGASVNDNYWSTETGSPITMLALGPSYHPLPCKPGSAGLPAPGMDVRIVNDEGKEVGANEMGNLVLASPLAPTALGGLWENKEGFHSAYWSRFEGKGDWFDTGDAAVRDDDGYITIAARNDDIIQVAGHRMGTGLLEQTVTNHPDVIECCVVGAPDKMKGQIPLALVVARGEGKDGAAMFKSINSHLRAEVGPISQLGALLFTTALPKTRSGKTLRKVVKVICERAAEGKKSTPETLPIPPTIDNVEAVNLAITAIERHFGISERL